MSRERVEQYKRWWTRGDHRHWSKHTTFFLDNLPVEGTRAVVIEVTELLSEKQLYHSDDFCRRHLGKLVCPMHLNSITDEKASALVRYCWDDVHEWRGVCACGYDMARRMPSTLHGGTLLLQATPTVVETDLLSSEVYRLIVPDLSQDERELLVVSIMDRYSRPELLFNISVREAGFGCTSVRPLAALCEFSIATSYVREMLAGTLPFDLCRGMFAQWREAKGLPPRVARDV